MTEQGDLFGGWTPVEQLDWPAVVAYLAAHEREHAVTLTVDEAGALVHARRGKHPADARCDYCAIDGAGALARLRERGDSPGPGGRQERSTPRLADTPAGPALTRDPEPDV